MSFIFFLNLVHFYLYALFIIALVSTDFFCASRKLFSHVSILETRSSLVWFVRKVQDKIILCALRRSIVKGANKLR